MTVQHGDDYAATSSYDLRNGYTEMAVPDARSHQLAWIGMTPDGTLGLANGEPLDVGGDPISQLYDMDTGDVVAVERADPISCARRRSRRSRTTASTSRSTS